MRSSSAAYGACDVESSFRVQRSLLRTSLCIWCAVPAIEFTTDEACSSLDSRHPRPVNPGRRVADMLLVSTLKFRNPFSGVILMEAHNVSQHESTTKSSVARFPVPEYPMI